MVWTFRLGEQKKHLFRHELKAFDKPDSPEMFTCE